MEEELLSILSICDGCRHLMYVHDDDEGCLDCHDKKTECHLWLQFESERQ